MLPSCDTSRGGVKPEPWYNKGEADRHEEKEEQLILGGILEGLREHQNIVQQRNPQQEGGVGQRDVTRRWPHHWRKIVAIVARHLLIVLSFLKKTSPACKQVLKMFKTN